MKPKTLMNGVTMLIDMASKGEVRKKLKNREGAMDAIEELLKGYDKVLFLNIVRAIKKSHEDTINSLRKSGVK